MEALKQAKEIAGQILEMTQALVLTGAKGREEEESVGYAELIEEREPLIEELTDLRQQINETEASSAEFAEIRNIIEKITAADKRHLEIIGVMHRDAQASYKEVKQGQRIHAGYNPLPGNEVSSKFDVKH